MRSLLFPIVFMMASATVLSAQAEGSVAVTLEIRGNATTDVPADLTPPARQEARISSHKAASPSNSAWSMASRQPDPSSMFSPVGLVVTCIEVALCRMGEASTPGTPLAAAGETVSAPAILIIFPDL